MRRRPFVFLALLIPGICLAQAGPNSWESLKQLQPGQEIKVVNAQMKTFQGEFVSFSDQALVLRDRTGQQSVSRPEVMRVSAKGRGHRWAWVGAGIGAGLGVVAMAMDCKNDRPGCGATGIVTAVPLGAGVGALAGYFIPSGGWKDVYRAEAAERRSPAEAVATAHSLRE